MSLSRLTLPENFYDITSAQLLVQPEPQYVMAQLYLAAIGASLPIPASYGLDGRQAASAGAAYSATDRDRLKLAQDLPTSLFSVGIDFSKMPGMTVRINRPAFTDSTYTVAARRVATGQAISTTPIVPTSEQTHLTLERYAGPYSNAGSAVQPFALESFDAQAGVHSFASMIGTHMKRDFHKFLESVCVTLTDSAGTTVYPDGMTADNDAGTAGSFPMTVEQLSRTHQLMSEASLPTLGDGKRLMMLSPYQWKQLKHDPEYAANSAFHPEFNILFGGGGYVGTVGMFHIFECSTLNKPNNGSSVPVHRGVAFAPGAFMAGMGRKPRVAVSTNDNYGETALAIWLADLAFGIADSRFIYSVRSA